MINLIDVSVQRGAKQLLQGASLRINPGHKLGLIGANGSGKSTLLQLLCGNLAVDAGDCQVPGQWRIAHMAQEVGHSDRSAIDYVLDGDSELRRIEKAISDTDADQGDKLGQLYSQLEAIDGYTANARAQTLLHGLGFQPEDSDKPVSAFSGGWRIRLNLAQALMCPADLLLLDEPTNHLDLDTTWWLEQRLQQFEGTLVIISHDRDFLDNVVDHTVHLHNQQLTLYRGNYSAFERQRAEQLAQQQALFAKQQQQVASIEAFVARFRAKATKARQAQSRLKALERLEMIAPAHVDSPFSFRLPCAEKVSSPLLNLSHARLGYADTPILDQVQLSIAPHTRLGLLGPNGAGKSTLMKSLMGDLALLNGERTCGEHLAIGYFAQHTLEALDMAASPLLHVQRLSPQAREQDMRNFLGGFGFQGDRVDEVIQHFSGGEKARLALALIAWQKPNLLLLDEPTNHLDLEMREALTLALQEFAGAVVVISHDRHLLRNTVDDFVVVIDGKVDVFDGDLDDYHRWLDQRHQHEDNYSQQEATEEPKQDRKSQRQAAAAKRQQLQPLRKKVQHAEKQMEKLQAKLEKVETELADESLYTDAKRKDDLQQLLKEQGDLRQQLEEIEEEWLTLSEEYEALSQE
ncbi:ATP-binding cassette domain-containing protein [Maricurvus nonylphenolicus]|uniref:ATP-binding cassette domain-containing protein n=1 Tax=Maricurvus nonylphenolicus TaxID=1008307 RepID=UPI0036F22A65